MNLNQNAMNNLTQVKLKVMHLHSLSRHITINEITRIRFEP